MNWLTYFHIMLIAKYLHTVMCFLSQPQKRGLGFRTRPLLLSRQCSFSPTSRRDELIALMLVVDLRLRKMIGSTITYFKCYHRNSTEGISPFLVWNVIYGASVKGDIFSFSRQWEVCCSIMLNRVIIQHASRMVCICH